MTASGYLEPEVKMQDERLMYSQMRSFMYGEGVLARSANCRPFQFYRMTFSNDHWTGKRI